MSHFEPIAIVGIGGVFPGAADLDAFWRNILAGRSAANEVPQARWPLPKSCMYAPEIGALDKAYSTRACLIDRDAWPLQFAASDDGPGLHLPPELAEALDPVARLALYAGQQAFAAAGAQRWNRARMGVILGNLALPTESVSRLAWEQLGLGGMSRVHPLNTLVAGLPAAVLARALRLGGAAHTLDAACASSLYALKLACDALQSGAADAMLAGGVSRPDCLYTQMGFSQLRALSPSGRSAPFDAHADGLVVGEGAGIFVLRRLRDAVASGEPILGVIRGIGLSNDVGGKLLAPSSEGQLRAMRAAYQAAGWTPDSVDLFECHATGTPVGDAVEFESLRGLWAEAGTRPQRCVIGSVKSNVGHMLTAAGAAALTKVLYALRDKTLPPSANYTHAPESFRIQDSPFEVLREGRAWDAPEGRPRRAAVSAFGFGGINAHVLVEAWDAAQYAAAPVRAKQAPPCKVAIVGMGARFGRWETRHGLEQQVLFGTATGAVPASAAPQAMTEIAVPLNRFRIPPRELEEMLPQQVIALDMALRAWEDAGLEQEARSDAGVFLGVALDLNTTNYHVRWMGLDPEMDGQEPAGLGPALTPNRVMGGLASVAASRIARELRCGGPSFVLAAEALSGVHALHAAVHALETHELNVALAGAVDLPSDPRSAAALAQLRQEQGLAPQPMCDGAVALVLKRLDDAQRDGDHVYAVLDQVRVAGSFGRRDPREPETGHGGISGAGRPQLVVCDAGVEALLDAHADPAPGATSPVLFQPGDRLGHAGAAAGLGAIAAAVLCLDHAVLPAQAEAAPEPLAPPEELRIRRLRYPEPWLRNRAEGPRQALAAGKSITGGTFRVLLTSPDPVAARAGGIQTSALPIVSEALFVARAASPAALREAVIALGRFVQKVNGTVGEAARRWWEQERQREDTRSGSHFCVAACVARSVEELVAQTEALARHLEHAPSDPFARQAELPGGTLQDRVFYTPRPLALEGGIAFVFPGSGNQFAEMGRELLLHFPEVIAAQDAENDYLRRQYRPERFWNVTTLEELAEDHEALIFGQVALGTAVSDVARLFGIAPRAVVGYSLGETAGLFASRAWTARDEMLRRVADSRLFTHDLAGDCDAARRRWKLPKQEAVDWVLGVIDRPMNLAKSALANTKKVYPLIANTLHESVIGGNRGAVEKLIKTLQCQFIPLKGVTTVHCEVVKEVEQEYHDLHLFQTHPPEGVRFYSGAWGRSYTVTRESAADSILAQAIEGVDYPKVIDAAYGDGARIFIEMGPGNSCTRMIGRILGDRPHVARALCHAGQDAWSILLRGLAELAAEGAPVQLDRLYAGLPVSESASGPMVVVRNEVLNQRGPAPPVLQAAPGIPTPPPPATQLLEAGAPRASASGRSPEPGPQALQAASSSPTPPPPAPPLLEAGAREAWSRATSAVLDQWSAAEAAKGEAHRAYLQFAESMHATLAQVLQGHVLPAAAPEAAAVETEQILPQTPADPNQVPRALDRDQCMEFAVGEIGRVLGARYAAIDAHPTRVRLPDTPLMLVDRITCIEGEPCSLQPGRVVTEHDVLRDGWYLDGGRIPTCIAVEAGQADLFLSGFLGIDFETKGLAMYRLLDAEVTFLRGLPRAGEVIRYDIHIDRFFRHGNPWFFHFHFDAYVGGERLMTMRNGCAGFFTGAELAAGQGVVTPGVDRARLKGVLPDGWRTLVEMGAAAYTGEQLDALRAGVLAACFGPAFSGLALRQPLTLPGGRMRLVHRVTELLPEGGRSGLGSIRAEADIHPEDWFITCHFVDDRVMPGTLMYECCLHTLRIFLMRMGWVGEADAVAWEPVPGVSSRLKCRGQVLETTRVVTYEVTLKELGYRPEPYCIADARMYADGKPIVDIIDMSLQLSGQCLEMLEALWGGAHPRAESSPPLLVTAPKPAVYDEASILAFAEGKPSHAFGERYRIFDEERRIARLPRPPYAFVSRITETQHDPWRMEAGGAVEGQYDIPANAWYFESNRHDEMPFAVLLEAVLQVCGWFSSYMGSALHSEVDLKYRNLGGTCTQLLPVTRETGLLTTQVRCTGVSHSGGMIIQHFEMEAHSPAGLVYRGATYFGFFSPDALANQLGVREAQRYQPGEAELASARAFPYPTEAPFPDARLRMVEQIDLFAPAGGPQGLGFLRGSKKIDPEEWFFRAHFYQDPVWPGSLGLESFLQLLKVAAVERWGNDLRFETPARGLQHEWIYRGQVLPTQGEVQVEAVITGIDDASRTITGDGFLIVDGLTIYQMKQFSVRAHGQAGE